MRGLLLRLSELDPDAGASLRVIEYFDRLVQNGAGLDELTRASAALGCCTAGLRDNQSGTVIRFDNDGRRSPPVGHPLAIEGTVVVKDRVVAHVWLERAELHALDEILIERMAMAAAARWRPFGAAGVDPALVELVIGSATEEQDRSRALRLLGLTPMGRLQVLAVSVDSEDLPVEVQRIARAVVSGGGAARGAALGAMGVIIAQTPNNLADLLRGLALPAGVRVGLGGAVPVSQAADSWNQARTAAKFGIAWQCGGITSYGDLGSLALLTAIPLDKVRMNGDVAALAALAETERGRQDIDVLLAVTWHGSARQAANALHMHHSSVTSRLRHVESALRLSVDDPAGWLRAQIAAIVWRLTA